MNHSRKISLPGVLLGAFLCAPALVSAQEQPMPSKPVTKDAPSMEHTMATQPGVYRASKLLGKDIVNASNVTVGSLKDVIVEDAGGLIAVVKRSDGELAGIPMESLTPRLDVKDGKAEQKVKVKEFTLTGPADQLNSAPVVKDVDHIDEAWVARVRGHGAAASGGADTTGGDTEAMGSSHANRPRCVEKLVGMNVKDTSGADVGNLEEIVVSLPDSRLAYAVVSTGGVLGMGDTLRGVAWRSLTLDNTGKHFNIAADKAALEKLPSVDLDHLTARPDLQANAAAPGPGPVAQEPSR